MQQSQENTFPLATILKKINARHPGAAEIITNRFVVFGRIERYKELNPSPEPMNLTNYCRHLFEKFADGLTPLWGAATVKKPAMSQEEREKALHDRMAVQMRRAILGYIKENDLSCVELQLNDAEKESLGLKKTTDSRFFNSQPA